MYVLSLDKRAAVVSCLVDGCSIRATERLTGVPKKTIGRFILALGDGCTRVHDGFMRELDLEWVQLDEQHSFVHTRQITYVNRQKRAERERKPEPPPPPVDRGEQWTFIAF